MGEYEPHYVTRMADGYCGHSLEIDDDIDVVYERHAEACSVRNGTASPAEMDRARVFQAATLKARETRVVYEAERAAEVAQLERDFEAG